MQLGMRYVDHLAKDYLSTTLEFLEETVKVERNDLRLTEFRRELLPF